MSGVATSALGGRFGRCVFTEFFSIVTVPEIHWLLSDLLAFSDNDGIFYRSALGRMTSYFSLGFCDCLRISFFFLFFFFMTGNTERAQ